MIPLETVFTVLDRLRAEALELAESPGDDRKTAFDFGSVSGQLRILRILKDEFSGVAEQENARERDL